MNPCSKCGVFHAADVACFVVGQTARGTREAEIAHRKPPSRTHTLVLYPSDRITMTGPLHAELLMVHLGLPGPRVEVGAHDLTYDALELIGMGGAAFFRDGVEIVKFFAGPAPGDAQRLVTVVDRRSKSVLVY